MNEYVYLDWNIFQDLKQNDNPKRYVEGLYENVESLKKRYIIPYSEAHLRDLAQSNNDIYINEDLEFINSFTNKYCLKYNQSNEHDFNIIIKDSKVIFDNLNKTQKENNDIIYCCNIFNEKMPPYRVDISRISKENILYDFLCENDLFMDNSVMTRLFNYLYNNIFEDKNVFKKFRNSIKEISSFDINIFRNMDDLYFFCENINQDKLFINENVIRLLNGFLSISGRFADTISFGEKITTLYGMLDYFPAYSEKINKKNKLHNISNDGLHIYYASSAKYFILNDENLLEKVIFIYEKLGIKTKVYGKTDLIQITFI